MTGKSLFYRNRFLNFKEIAGRIEKSLKPFKSKITHNIYVSKLKNSVYCNIDYRGCLYQIRVSNHDNENFNGLNIVIRDDNSGIVKAVRNFANMIVSDTKISPKTETVIRRQFNNLTLEDLTTQELEELEKKIVDILTSREDYVSNLTDKDFDFPFEDFENELD